MRRDITETKFQKGRFLFTQTLHPSFNGINEFSNSYSLTFSFVMWFDQRCSFHSIYGVSHNFKLLEQLCNTAVFSVFCSQFSSNSCSTIVLVHFHGKLSFQPPNNVSLSSIWVEESKSIEPGNNMWIIK